LNTCIDLNPHHSASAWQLLGRALFDAHQVIIGSGTIISGSDRSLKNKFPGKNGIFKNETNTDSVAGLLKTLSGGNRSLTLVDYAQEALEKAVRACESPAEKEVMALALPLM
jgi:hypothetical protein